MPTLKILKKFGKPGKSFEKTVATQLKIV